MRCLIKRCRFTVTYSEKEGGYCDAHGAALHRLRAYPRQHNCGHCTSRAAIRRDTKRAKDETNAEKATA